MAEAQTVSGVRQPPGSKNRRWGVLLLAHGAPDRPEDIPEFLLNVRSGRKLPEPALRAIIDRYAKIGGGSPLLRLTNLQAKALEAALNAQHDGSDPLDRRPSVPVYVGMRNWRPFISDAVRRLSSEGIERIVALCLAPQNSSTSVGLYKKRLYEAGAMHDPRLEVDFITSWHDHPGLIAAFAEKVLKALAENGSQAQGPIPVIFTAHSVPVKTLHAGDAYEIQVRETARLVARAAKLTEWKLAFQSQGMTEDPWLGPPVERELDRLAAEGRGAVLIAPVGFVSDHIEVLYDIDVGFREYAATKGIKLWRTESLNDSPLFIQALASLVGNRVKSTMRD